MLQIDHRTPYEIAGDADRRTVQPDDFMLLCGSANRAKSWSCEHCDNWKRIRDPVICRSCYWAYPEDYSHVAMKQIRRLDLIWEDESVSQYDKIRENAAAYGIPLPDLSKRLSEGKSVTTRTAISANSKSIVKSPRFDAQAVWIPTKSGRRTLLRSVSGNCCDTETNE